jgi:hypothetical protein
VQIGRVNAPLHQWYSEALAAVQDRRRANRLPVLIQAQKRDGGEDPVPVTVTDLTAEGCRIEGDFDVAEGAEVWLAIPGIAPRRARIAWTQVKAAGCEFLFPLRADLAEDIARTSKPSAD